MLKRARYERWLTVALLELALLRQRFDCARARAAAFARLRARAQSDTGVGKVLNLDEHQQNSSSGALYITMHH